MEKWRPWQQAILDSIDEWDPNHINFVYDPKGWLGKSTISGWLGSSRIGLEIPSELTKDPKDVMQFVHGFPNKRVYLIDIPRADKQTATMWRTFESLKKGYVYDVRNKARCRYMDSPNIWVFGNTMPNPAFITKKRWQVKKINRLGLFEAVDFATCNSVYKEQLSSSLIYSQRPAQPAQNTNSLGELGVSDRLNSNSPVTQMAQDENLDYDDFEY